MLDHTISPNDSSGFSLVELMLSLSIIGIMAAVIYSVSTSTVPRYSLRAEVRELVIGFKQARMEAIKRNQNVVLIFNPPGSYTLFADANGNGAMDAGEFLRTQPLRQNLQLTNVTFTANATWFTANGLVPLAKTGACQIRLLDNSHCYRLTLSSNGAVRLESSTDGGATWSVAN